MSGEPDSSEDSPQAWRSVAKDSTHQGPISAIRDSLHRHLGLFLTLSFGTGLGCGVLAVFVDGLSSEGIPFLEWSVGLYVTSPVLLGWLAIRSWAATIAGSVAYLSTVLGHLATTHLTTNDYVVQEYWVWAPIGLFLGALLGFLGNRIRSQATVVRAFAAGFPLSLMALFLLGSVRTYLEPDGVEVHVGVLILEVALGLLILALCRGWKARGAALVWTVALVIPLAFALLQVFSLVWFASGDY